MLFGSILTNSANGSCNRRAIDTAPRNDTSRSGNSFAASSDAEYTDAPASDTITFTGFSAPGSTANFRQSWWRSSRTIPLLTATTKSGTLAIGTVTADSAGNPAATYGSFSLQQTANAVNLVWTPIPGFPVIDTPTLALLSPSVAPVAITDILTSLRVAATVGGGASVSWSQVSGPGTVTFGNPNSSDTSAQFSATGTYVLRATASTYCRSALPSSGPSSGARARVMPAVLSGVVTGAV